MKLNPKKVINEIQSLKDRLLNSNQEDFHELHEDILRFCEIIYSKKTDYKEIFKEPEEGVVQIVLESEDGEKKEIKIPGDDEILERRNNLIKNITKILNEIEKKYLLKQKLME